MVKIGYILEDIAQQNFILTLVKRIIEPVIDIVFERLPGGGSRVDVSFIEYLKNCAKNGNPYDLMIVCHDANKKGVAKTKRHFESRINKICKSGCVPIVFALPDPHIERWYLLDQNAFASAVKGQANFNLPPLRKKKDFYKKYLADAIKSAGKKSVYGGAEFGEDIAININFKVAGSRDESFKAFINDLQLFLSSVKDK